MGACAGRGVRLNGGMEPDLRDPPPDHLPPPGLPGVRPMQGGWLTQDGDLPGALALRDRLLVEHGDAVVAEPEEALPVLRLGLERVLRELRSVPGYAVGPDTVQRPDGAEVPLDPDRPMTALARLVQEDVIVMDRGPDGLHRLMGGTLLFPSLWSLREKLGRPLPGIHAPVPVYDEALARRVQRLFDGLHPDRPLERSNRLPYAEPALHQPRSEAEAKGRRPGLPWIRRERQVLMGLLDRGGPALFTIRTYVARAPADGDASRA